MECELAFEWLDVILDDMEDGQDEDDRLRDNQEDTSSEQVEGAREESMT